MCQWNITDTIEYEDQQFIERVTREWKDFTIVLFIIVLVIQTKLTIHFSKLTIVVILLMDAPSSNRFLREIVFKKPYSTLFILNW